MSRPGENWRCWRDGTDVVTSRYGRETRKAIKEAHAGRTLIEQADWWVEYRTRQHAKKVGATLRPMIPREWDGCEGDVVCQPVVRGVRVLISWHRGDIRVQSLSGTNYRPVELLKYLRGPRYTTGSGPLQAKAILDGFLCHEDGVQGVMKCMRKRGGTKALTFRVYDAIVPGGHQARLRGKSARGVYIPGAVERVCGGPVRLASYCHIEQPGHIWIRPIAAPYVMGEDHASLFEKKA